MGCSLGGGSASSLRKQIQKDRVQAIGARADKQFHRKYQLGKKLGEGRFGQVHQVVDTRSQQQLAVKIVDVRAPSGELSLTKAKSVESEVDVWGKVSHSKCEFVVQLHAYYLEKELFYIVCEACGQPLLAEVEKDMTEADLSGIFHQMLQGISHIHSLGFVHRDIKPDNFLWGGIDNSILKLSDFGLAVMMPNAGKLKGVAGTAPYMSPEMLKEEGYDHTTDVWSLGATAHLLVFGGYPYSPATDGPEAYKEAIKADVPPMTFPKEGHELFESPAVNFVKALLVREQLHRPSLAQAIGIAQAMTGKNSIGTEEHTPPLQPRAESWSSTMSASLANSLKRAQQLNYQYQSQERLDPTYQKSINELLQKLVERGDASFAFFSEDDGKLEVISEKVTRVKKRNLRADKFSTHPGVTTSTDDVSDLRALAKAPEDAMASAALVKTATDVEGHPMAVLT